MRNVSNSLIIIVSIILTFLFCQNALSQTTCPADKIVLVNAAPITLDEATPPGGTYSGPGVSGDVSSGYVFDPSTAGPNDHVITYTPPSVPTSLLHYWNFNDDVPDSFTNWDQPIYSHVSSQIDDGEITYTFSQAYSFVGTTINGIDGEVNGGSFVPRGGPNDEENNGRHFTITAPTTGYEEIELSYATRRTGTGFTTQEIQYTIDGTNWVTRETVDISGFSNSWTAGQVIRVDFSDISVVSNNPDFAIRIVLTGATSLAGNNRFDNIQINGRPIPTSCSFQISVNVEPWDCGGDPRLFLSMRRTSGSPWVDFIEIDTSDNPFEFPVTGSTRQLYNAIGLNPADNFVYAMGTQDDFRDILYRIGTDGVAYEVGNVAEFEASDVQPFNAGAFNPDDGLFYVKRSLSNNQIFKIDVNDLDSEPEILTLTESMNLGDIDFLNGYIYGWGNQRLWRIDPGNGDVYEYPVGGDGLSVGAIWSDGRGIFIQDNNGSGFYAVDVGTVAEPGTGALTLVSSAPESPSTDGAFCGPLPLSFDADLAITKTDNSDIFTRGSLVSYTIVASNYGPFGAGNVVITDELPEDATFISVTCGNEIGGAVCGPIGDTTGSTIVLDANLSLPAPQPADPLVPSSVTYNLTIEVPEDFAGDLVNTAIITPADGTNDPDQTNNIATDTNTVVDVLVILNKTILGTPQDGGLFNLLISGGAPLGGNNPAIDSGNGGSTGNVRIIPGSTITLAESAGTDTDLANYYSTLSCVDGLGDILLNTAIGISHDITVPDSDATIDQRSITCTFTNSVLSMAMNKTASPTSYSAVGQTINYNYVVTNTGAVSISNLSVTDNRIPTVTCPDTILASGASTTCTGSYYITQLDLDAGYVTNMAVATGTPPSGPNITATDSETIIAVQNPSLSITKTASPDTYNAAGDLISYTILVENTGNVTINDIEVEDPLTGLSTTIVSLAPGESQTFTEIYTVAQDDIDQGFFTNTATTRGTYSNDQGESIPVDEASDEETVYAQQNPSIQLRKEAETEGPVKIGDVITYTITVTNNGNLTIFDVNVVDEMIELTCNPELSADLAPDEHIVCTGTYEVTQKDVSQDRPIVNNASASGSYLDGIMVEDEDNLSIPVIVFTGFTSDPIPTMTEWGLMIMTVLFVISALYMRRRGHI